MFTVGNAPIPLLSALPATTFAALSADTGRTRRRCGGSLINDDADGRGAANRLRSASAAAADPGRSRCGGRCADDGGPADSKREYSDGGEGDDDATTAAGGGYWMAGGVGGLSRTARLI